MVRPARLERATFWFVAKRSIQLSYGRDGVGLVSYFSTCSRAHRLQHHRFVVVEATQPSILMAHFDALKLRVVAGAGCKLRDAHEACLDQTIR